jgi:hypothetical protein
MGDLGLNSTALNLIAQTMRNQTQPPNNEMSYSDFAGTTATYAVINALELIASGLQAEEDRQQHIAVANDLRKAHFVRLAHDPEYRTSYLNIEDDRDRFVTEDLDPANIYEDEELIVLQEKDE